MIQRLRAIFRHGTFVLRDRCELPEEMEVELQVTAPPVANGSAERALIKQRLIERLRSSQLSSDAPRLSRDDLHERG